MSDINKEIEALAENMEKSVQEEKGETLEETITRLGPEGLKKAMPTLTEGELDLLRFTLEDMVKAKATQEEAPAAPVIEGKLTDTKIQEEKGDDDEDEKLVKEKNKDINHQGDVSPEGREGQIIKAESEMEVEIEEENGKKEAKIEVPAKEMVKEHEKLVDVLESDDKKDDKKEAKKQAKELKEYKEAEKKVKKSEDKSMSEDPALESKEDLKKKKGVPEGVDPAKQERCVKDVKAQGKDKSSAFAICNASMKKSDINDLVEESYEPEVELDMEWISKSLNNDPAVISDYLQTDDTEFALGLLKGEKIVSRNGMRYYASGPNSGKLVGSVRGDKASAKSIERARKKGKVSAKAANEGMKQAHAAEKYERRREKMGMGRSNSLEQVTKDAAHKQAQGKHGLKSPEYKKVSQEHIKKIGEMAKPVREARGKLEYTKEGKLKNTKGSQKKYQDFKEKKEKFSEDRVSAENKFHKEHRKVYGDKGRAKQKEYEQKRSEMRSAAMKKSDLLELKDEVIKSFEAEGIEYTTEMVKGKMKELAMDMEAKKKESEENKEEKMEKKCMKKSIPWTPEYKPFQKNTLGRNHNFSVNEYYDNALAKSEEKPEETETLEKSQKANDLNDIIEKSQDQSWDEYNTQQALDQHNPQGHRDTTFDNMDVATAMGISEEEAKKILG